ncbi:hypothetical protein Tco_0462284 [Tanacetum coccineum]
MICVSIEVGSCGSSEDGRVLGGTSRSLVYDSSMEDGVLVAAFGGIGDCGVVIGDGVLAMGEFDGEATCEFGGDGVTKLIKSKCLTLILGFLLRAFVERSLKRPLLYERRLKMKRGLNEDEDELDI